MEKGNNKQYFKSTKIDENILCIQDPAGVNMTLFLGCEKALLFDTGYGFGNLKHYIRGFTKLPIVVVNSHCHFDHVLGNWEFEEIYMQKEDVEWYDFYTSKEMRKAIWDSAGKSAGNVRVSKAVSDAVIPPVSRELYLEKVYPVPFEISGEETWDLGGLCLKTVRICGHTKGSIGLLDIKGKRIFAGDGANHRMLLHLPGSAGIEAYMDSLKRLQKEAFESMYFSHNIEGYKKKELEIFLKCAIESKEHQGETFLLYEMSRYPGMLYPGPEMSTGEKTAIVCVG